MDRPGTLNKNSKFFYIYRKTGIFKIILYVPEISENYFFTFIYKKPCSAKSQYY